MPSHVPSRISPFPVRLSTILLAAVGTVLLAGCGGDAQSQDSSAQESEEVVPAVPVEAGYAELGEIAAFFTGTATLEAEDEAFVVAKAGGIVTQIFAEEGSFVRAGSALAKLDDQRLVLDMDRARVTLEKLEREANRQQEMFEKQLVSAEEYERVRSDFEAQKASFELAKLQVDYTTVTAPISGVVSERFIKVGNMLQTNAQAFRITDFTPLLAILFVPERELAKINVGQKAEVRVDALGDDIFGGKVKRVSPIVDPATGTFKVTVEVVDRSRKLKPGMFGRVNIVYDTRTNTVLVPRSAVTTEDTDETVFAIADSIAIRRSIRTGYTNATHTEVLSGLTVGDRVITIGQNNLRDSSRVIVINQ